MKNTLVLMLTALTILTTSCDNDDDTLDNSPMEQSATFTVTIENVITPQPIFQSGVFNTPVGSMEPAPLFPNDAYEFEIDAGPVVTPNDGGTRLSFVAMFVQSNDLFFAPGEEGIALYNASGNPIGASGPVDVTDQVLLWDAGTEVNEPTGGPNQKPQQAAEAEDQGVDENGNVLEIMNNTDAIGNVLPKVEDVITVTIENIADAKFLVRIENVSDSSTIETLTGTAAVPVSPGVYAVHTVSSPFFVEGSPAANAGAIASAEGVEDIAEDGFPEALAMDTDAATGLIVPLSPGAFAVHEAGIQPLYQINTPDYGDGLEGIAEDGKPETLVTSLMNNGAISVSGAFDTAVGSSTPGAIGPGGSYQFSFEASEGDNLSLATMFVQSNDWFYAFNSNGLALFNNGSAVTGDVTNQIFLYDAGTETDEVPGAGLFQVIRQPDTDTGSDDANTNVRLITPSASNGLPSNSSVIRVTISAQ